MSSNSIDNIKNLPKINVDIVDRLPEYGIPGVIYVKPILVKKKNMSEDDSTNTSNKKDIVKYQYEKYVWLNGAFYKIGPFTTL